MNISKVIQLVLYGAIIGYELPRMVGRLKQDPMASSQKKCIDTCSNELRQVRVSELNLNR